MIIAFDSFVNVSRNQAKSDKKHGKFTSWNVWTFYESTAEYGRPNGDMSSRCLGSIQKMFKIVLNYDVTTPFKPQISAFIFSNGNIKRRIIALFHRTKYSKFSKVWYKNDSQPASWPMNIRDSQLLILELHLICRFVSIIKLGVTFHAVITYCL